MADRWFSNDEPEQMSRLPQRHWDRYGLDRAKDDADAA